MNHSHWFYVVRDIAHICWFASPFIFCKFFLESKEDYYDGVGFFISGFAYLMLIIGYVEGWNVLGAK